MLQIFYHPNSLLHYMGDTHLEAPIRLKIIEEEIKKAVFKTKFITSDAATKEEILQLHSRQLFDELEDSQKHDKTIFTLDTIANKYTFSAALTAAGAAINLANHIKDRSYQFAMIRPPGHHSTFNQAMGFCFLNNIAIATNHLRNKGIRKIAIIDVDHHHGNGTQNFFENIPEVLYTSLHADPHVAYPGTGFLTEIGSGEGIGTTVNIPLPIGTADAEYLTAFDEIIAPIVTQYNPEVILVSLGLDALKNDPYGILGLTPEGYYEIGKRIGKLGENLCKKRIGILLEGGYKYEEIGIATRMFFKGLEEIDADIDIKLDLHYQLEKILRKVKAIQRNYWFDI